MCWYCEVSRASFFLILYPLYSLNTFKSPLFLCCLRHHTHYLLCAKLFISFRSLAFLSTLFLPMYFNHFLLLFTPLKPSLLPLSPSHLLISTLSFCLPLFLYLVLFSDNSHYCFTFICFYHG